MSASCGYECKFDGQKERAAEAAQVAEEETIPATNGILIS